MIKKILSWFGFGKNETPAKMNAVVAQAPAQVIVETTKVEPIAPAVEEKKPHHFNRNRNRGRKKKHAMQSANAATTATPTTANNQKRRGRPTKQAK